MAEGLLDIVIRTLWIAGAALLISAAFSIPISLTIGLRKFRGRETLISIFNSLTGMPTVALGLFLYLLFSNRGPLGLLDLLYTPGAIIIGQAILILPIFVSILTNAIESVDPQLRDLAKTLGASESQASMAVLKEAKKGGVLAAVSAFNRGIAELGVALMIGGNLAGVTRVMTTQISLGISRGEIDMAINLGLVLIAIVFVLTLISNRLRRD